MSKALRALGLVSILSLTACGASKTSATTSQPQGDAAQQDLATQTEPTTGCRALDYKFDPTKLVDFDTASKMLKSISLSTPKGFYMRGSLTNHGAQGPAALEATQAGETLDKSRTFPLSEYVVGTTFITHAPQDTPALGKPDPTIGLLIGFYPGGPEESLTQSKPDAKFEMAKTPCGHNVHIASLTPDATDKEATSLFIEVGPNDLMVVVTSSDFDTAELMNFASRLLETNQD